MGLLLQFKPEVLRWARESAGLDVDALAKKIPVKNRGIVEAWEESGQVSYSTAKKIAAATYTPLAFLYLSDPPVTELPIQDFRRPRSVVGQQMGSNLRRVLIEAMAKQEWYREYLVEAGAKPLPFVGCITTDLPPTKAAQTIRGLIPLNMELKSNEPNIGSALNILTEALEAQGILISRSGIVGNNTRRELSADEFRGFSLSDTFAPLIFVNSADWPSAQLFTVMHELVHICLGISALDNADGLPNNSTNRGSLSRTESFCNRVAGELLLPEAELLSLVKLYSFEKLKTRLNISGPVLLIRLKETGLIDAKEFYTRYEKEREEFESRRAIAESRRAREEKQRGNFYNSEILRVGRRFASSLIESTLEGRTTYREALFLLNLKTIQTFNKLASKIGFSV